jgi:preprotein translocase subunit YajC
LEQIVDPMMIIMLVAMLGLMFFMQTRARKQQRQRDEFRTRLAPGQRVMTQGGLVGTIVAINDEADTLIIDSAGSRCEYMRAGVAKTLDDTAGSVPAPAQGGLLGAMTSLTGAAKPAAVGDIDDEDLAILDSISKEYHGTSDASAPIATAVVSEDGE